MLQRIKTGVGIGLIFASLYSLYMIGLYVIQGEEPFPRMGTTVLTVIATYFSGGITAGAVVGILRPLGRWRLGAIFIGIVAHSSSSLGLQWLPTARRPRGAKEAGARC
jgi:hypothetical protein